MLSISKASAGCCASLSGLLDERCRPSSQLKFTWEWQQPQATLSNYIAYSMSLNLHCVQHELTSRWRYKQPQADLSICVCVQHGLTCLGPPVLSSLPSGASNPWGRPPNMPPSPAQP